MKLSIFFDGAVKHGEKLKFNLNNFAPSPFHAYRVYYPFPPARAVYKSNFMDSYLYTYSVL